MKLTEQTLRKIIKESLQEILMESRFSDNEERFDMNNLAKSIVADLKDLNFEERGHEIHVDTQDEYEPYVAVYYMNIPANADCREIAKKHNCYFYVDNSWGIGVFDLTREYTN